MKINLNSISNKKYIRSIALSTAALLLSATSWANPVFDQPDTDFRAMLRSANAVYPGGQAEITGFGFKAGQEIKLLRGEQTLSGNESLIANEEGKINITIPIPDDAIVGLHPIIVQVSKPSAATVFDLKISPQLDITGESLFTITQSPVSAGLYQVAYSSKNDALFITASTGRSTNQDSKLHKVDPNTLEVITSITPEPLIAVYGIAVDDSHNTLWATNTRANTVAVYDQKGLKLIKQFEKNTVPHARDVIIDTELQRAFVSSPTSNKLYVFDTKQLKALDAIDIPSNTRQSFSAMSMDYDEKNHTLYTVSRNTNELAIIDTKADVPSIKTLALTGVKNASGVAVATAHKRAFVSGQSTDNVVIIDLEKEEIIQDVLVGSTPLNIVWDESTQLAYIANRASDTVTAIDINGNITANLPVGSFPNHLALDGKGGIYLVNKARGQDDKSGDHITKILFKK